MTTTVKTIAATKSDIRLNSDGQNFLTCPLILLKAFGLIQLLEDQLLTSITHLLQWEQVDMEQANLLRSSDSLDSAFSTLEAQLQQLDAAESRLASQQDDIANQLLQLSVLQDQVELDQGELHSKATHLCQQEADLSEQRASLAAQAEHLTTAVAAKGAELDAAARDCKEAAVTAQQPPPPPGPCKAASKPTEEEVHIAKALSVLENRQRELEKLKHALQDKHRALAEDLSAKQMGLNEQWAALDIDQSRAEAKEHSLHTQSSQLQSQSLELDSEWQVIEEEWTALEAQKAQLRSSQAAIEETQAGRLVSVSSEAATEYSDPDHPLQLSETEITTWRESLDKQLTDIAGEWAAVNAERGRLNAEREALRVREEALIKAEASREVAESDPFRLKLAESPADMPSLASRGDSPRDLKVRKLWSSSQVIFLPFCSLIDLIIVQIKLTWCLGHALCRTRQCSSMNETKKRCLGFCLAQSIRTIRSFGSNFSRMLPSKSLYADWKTRTSRLQNLSVETWFKSLIHQR